MTQINPLQSIQKPASKRIALRISKKAEKKVRQGHPWLYDQAITSQSHDGQPGDLAVIFDDKRKFLAIGLFDPQSPIRVKILHALTPVTIDDEWFRAQIQAAYQKRGVLADQGTTGYRVIYGEGDGLPGLIVDRYGDALVAKLYSAAWFPYLHIVSETLRKITGATLGILRLSRLLQKDGERLGIKDGSSLWGTFTESRIPFIENDLKFEADIIHGHKTGFFFDHRDNRRRVGQLANGKRVLDLFAYSGGFSTYAAVGGAKTVTSIDISRPALDAAERNVQLNLAQDELDRLKHQTISGDIFEILPQMRKKREKYDLIVADPPSFAKSQNEIPGALKAYRRLTHQALDLLDSQGILVYASCSSRVPADLFFDTIFAAADEHDRPLWVQNKTGHALDHPTRDSFSEGAYLKCLFATTID